MTLATAVTFRVRERSKRITRSHEFGTRTAAFAATGALSNGCAEPNRPLAHEDRFATTVERPRTTTLMPRDAGLPDR
jgi:hypothetical protein